MNRFIRLHAVDRQIGASAAKSAVLQGVSLGDRAMIGASEPDTLTYGR